MSESTSFGTTIPLGKVNPLDLKALISSPIAISPSLIEAPTAKVKPKGKQRAKLEESNTIPTSELNSWLLIFPFSMGIMYAVAYNLVSFDRCVAPNKTKPYIATKLRELIDPYQDIWSPPGSEHGIPDVLCITVRDINIHKSVLVMLKKYDINICYKDFAISDRSCPKPDINSILGCNHVRFLMDAINPYAGILSVFAKTIQDRIPVEKEEHHFSDLDYISGELSKLDFKEDN